MIIAVAEIADELDMRRERERERERYRITSMGLTLVTGRVESSFTERGRV